MHSRMNGTDRAPWVCHMALGFPSEPACSGDLTRAGMGTGPETGGAFEEQEASKGIRECAQGLYPEHTANSVNVQAEDFHVAVMTVKVTVIPSITPLLMTVHVPGAVDTKRIQTETTVVRSLQRSRQRETGEGRGLTSRTHKEWKAWAERPGGSLAGGARKVHST